MVGIPPHLPLPRLAHSSETSSGAVVSGAPPLIERMKHVLIRVFVFRVLHQGGFATEASPTDRR